MGVATAEVVGSAVFKTPGPGDNRCLFRDHLAAVVIRLRSDWERGFVRMEH